MGPEATRPLRLLLVDDSEEQLRALAELLLGEGGVEVVGRAADGEAALRLAAQLEPDAVLLDLEMPRMDGFTVLRLLLARHPVPVVVLSASARKQDVFKALELGACDFVSKPEGAGSDLSPVRDLLLAKLALVRGLRPCQSSAPRTLTPVPAPTPEPGAAPRLVPLARRPRPGRRAPARLAVVGASTGGPPALGRLLAGVPAGLPLAWAVAQHMPERFTRAFAERLARQTGLDVREAEEGDELGEGRVLVAPGGKHLKLVRDGPLAPVRAVLLACQPGDARRYCPSVDLLFESAGDVLGDRVCAVVLTGMGNDGRRGVERVKAAGGLALAESEDSAVVYGMPREAVGTGVVDEVLSLESLALRLRRFAEGR